MGKERFNSDSEEEEESQVESKKYNSLASPITTFPVNPNSSFLFGSEKSNQSNMNLHQELSQFQDESSEAQCQSEEIQNIEEIEFVEPQEPLTEEQFLTELCDLFEFVRPFRNSGRFTQSMTFGELISVCNELQIEELYKQIESFEEECLANIPDDSVADETIRYLCI